jgi:hypothetical protein
MRQGSAKTSRFEREEKMRRELPLWAVALCFFCAAAMPAQAQESPKYGGTLTYMISADSPPSFETYATIHSAAPFYSTLIRINPMNPGSATDIVCDLCTEMPKPTGGGAHDWCDDRRPNQADTAEALGALEPSVFSGVDAVLVLPDAMFWNHHRRIVALVNSTHLPAIYPEREYADDGGLMAYGANASHLAFAQRCQIALYPRRRSLDLTGSGPVQPWTAGPHGWPPATS